MLIMAALTMYTNALELIPTSQYAGLVLTFYGFVFPIVVSTTHRRFAFFQNKDGDRCADVSKADLSTVNNEEDYWSCEMCGLEH